MSKSTFDEQHAQRQLTRSGPRLDKPNVCDGSSHSKCSGRELRPEEFVIYNREARNVADSRVTADSSAYRGKGIHTKSTVNSCFPLQS